MAYSPHYLLQFGGNLGNARDIWTCGIRLRAGTFDSDSVNGPETYLEDVAVPALSAWMVRGSSCISINANLLFAKCNAIGVDGRYTQPVTHQADVSGVIGGAAGPIHPFQCSVVLTWTTTAARRGPGAFGRIYSPLPVLTVANLTGLFDGGQAQGMADSAGELIVALTAATGLPDVGSLTPVIASGTNAALNTITAASVDNKIDTQRRRSNAIPAVRFTSDSLGG